MATIAAHNAANRVVGPPALPQRIPNALFTRTVGALKYERKEYANTYRNNVCFGVHRALFASCLNKIIQVIGHNPTTTWKTQTTICAVLCPSEMAQVFLLFCIKAAPDITDCAWYLAMRWWPHLHAEAAVIQCARALMRGL